MDLFFIREHYNKNDKKNFMKLIFFIIFTFYSMNIFSQEIIETDFYQLKLPKSTTYKKVNSSKDELSVVEIFQLINSDNKQTKYLLYLMTNKLNFNIDSISEFNYKDYLKDIGEYSSIETKNLSYNGKKYLKVKVNLGNNVLGLVYIYYNNDILSRIFFMIPNENYFLDYKSEMDLIFKSVNLLKSRW